ncbi:hypothetical protein MKX03_019060 [Papaver bracteatum]|nr:hypothetical protein MKX03_019060 [Papaver bracteatum]
MPSGSTEITVSASKRGTNWCHLPILPDSSISCFHRCPRHQHRVYTHNPFQQPCTLPMSEEQQYLQKILSGSYPDEACYMEIEEPVDSRTISNVRYRLADARIYNERTTGLITDEAVNRLHVPVTSELNLTETVTNTTNWSRSVTLTVGVTTGGSAGIPFVANSWDWGTTKEESQQVGSVRTVDVPPMSRVRGTLMATRLSYDVPFSYTQRDVMKNGKTKVYQKDDGLFTGHNGYGYYYEIVPLPLD